MTQLLKQLLPDTALKKGLLLALYIAPLAALLWFVWQLSVDVPFRDQWDLVGYFSRVQAGEVGASDLFAQHNEHRMVLPKLLFSALAFTTHWNTRYEMAVSLFCAALTFLLLLATALRNFKLGVPRQAVVFHGANVAVGLLVFSWAQQENWLWGFQVPWFFINTCLAGVVFILAEDRLRPKYRLAIASILCFLASFSSAHGLFIWLAVLPSVASIGRLFKVKVQHIASWLLQFAVCMAIYLTNYKTPEGPAEYYSKSVPTFLGHFFASSGMSLLNESVDLSTLITVGVLAFGLFAALTFYSLRAIALAAPWISLGNYAIIFALVNSYGRSGLGIMSSLVGRYTTPGLLLFIAIVQLLPIAIETAGRTINRKFFYLTAAVFLALSIRTFAFGLKDAKQHAVVLRREATCVELIHYVQEERGMDSCFDGQVHKSSVLALGKLGLKEMPQDIAFLRATKDKGYADDIRLTLSEGKLEVDGYVELPEALAAADRPEAVALTLDDPQRFIAIAALDFTKKRGSLLETPHQRLVADWTTKMDLSALTVPVAQTRTLEGYLYYPQKKQFVPMETRVPLDTMNRWRMADKLLGPIESGQVSSGEDRPLERRTGPDNNPVVLAHANTRIVVAVPKEATSLSVSFGILDEAWQEAINRGESKQVDGVEFRVWEIGPDSQENHLFSQWVDPHAKESDRGEKSAVVALPAASAVSANGSPRSDSSLRSIVLETFEGANGSDGWDQSYWSGLTFE